MWFGASAVHAETGSVLTVTKVEDTNDGVCDDDCSLREAIGAASPGDRVDVPPGIYTVGSELIVFADVEIVGSGLEQTIIQASDSPATSTHGVFGIFNGKVTISGVTIRHGNGIIGGGILVEGNSFHNKNRRHTNYVWNRGWHPVSMRSNRFGGKGRRYRGFGG